MSRRSRSGTDEGSRKTSAPVKGKTQSSPERGRRNFILAVGGVAGLSVAGWFASSRVLGPHRRSISAGQPQAQRPRLRDDITIKSDGDQVEIYRTRPGAAPELVGRLNRAALGIVEKLNGEHTVEDLARNLMEGSGRPSQSAESAAAAVAAFVGELATAGLLATPFYANIQRAEFTA